MPSINDFLFGPLGSEFCLYFYFLAVIAFVMMAFVILGFVMSLFSKKMDVKVLFSTLMVAGSYALVYFVNRLLYTMCLKSESVGSKK
jgi:hypothetical protein